MAKIVCVLYEHPITGYATRDSIPTIQSYPTSRPVG